MSKEEDNLILKMRENKSDNGWARIASVINETFKIKRTANQIKNNYNQRLSKLENKKSQTFKTHEFLDSTEQLSGKLEFHKCSDEHFKQHDFHKTLEYEFHKLGKFSCSEINNIITSQVDMKIIEKPKNKDRKNRISKRQTPKIPIVVSNKMDISYLMNSMST